MGKHISEVRLKGSRDGGTTETAGQKGTAVLMAALHGPEGSSEEEGGT